MNSVSINTTDRAKMKTNQVSTLESLYSSGERHQIKIKNIILESGEVQWRKQRDRVRVGQGRPFWEGDICTKVVRLG
jgi:hypothetical protein